MHQLLEHVLALLLWHRLSGLERFEAIVARQGLVHRGDQRRLVQRSGG
jgi:hypothetical protein